MEKDLQRAQGFSERSLPLVHDTGDDLQVTYQEVEGTRELNYQKSIEVQHVTHLETFETEHVQQQSVAVQQVQQFSTQQSYEAQNITHKHSFSTQEKSQQQSFSIEDGVIHHLDEADQNQIIHQQFAEVQEITQPIVNRQISRQQSVDIVLTSQIPQEGKQIPQAGLHIVKHTTAEQVSGGIRLVKQYSGDSQQSSQLEYNDQGKQIDHDKSTIISTEQTDDEKDGSWHDTLKDAWQQSFGQIGGCPQILDRDGKEVEKVSLSVTNGKGDASIAEFTEDRQWYFDGKDVADGDSENPFRETCQGTEWKETITQWEDSATESVKTGKAREGFTRESGRSTSQSSSECSLDAMSSPKSSDKGAVFKFSHWTPGRTQSVRQIKVRTQDVRRTTSLGVENEPWYSTMEHHIKVLKDERESVQKKTFMKWVNSHLVRVNARIGDLYVDLRDGKQLIKLLEILSGERLPRPTKGKMRIHCLENVDKALQFLRDQRVHLENMGSHDIVDGNARLTLGLIWTIILRFQIQDITIEETENQETKSAKDALLLWCQMKTAGYHNVNIRNFTTSWRDGLAFNAIIHKHRPDLIQYEKLSRSNAMYNLNNAFNVAENKLGLTKLLDAEDVFVEQPDEKSIITYVVTYYHYFSKLKQETVQGKRIGKVVGIAMENDRMIKEYESLTSDLLKWIEVTIESLNDRVFTNSLTGVQAQLTQFNTYRTVEKPPKFVEKGNLEVLLFTLQSKMRANNQKPYLPKEGKMISDINKAWERLEKAEHERELALREELIRQEKLAQLAARFNRKAGMRETWLSENQRLVSQDNFGFDLAAVEAAAKKHEAIETDIFAYEERVQAVVSVANELEAERYHDIERINARKDNVLRLWNYLLELLRLRRMRLELSLQLQQNFQEMMYILDSMEDMKLRLLSEDYGKHLMGVEDLLQKHSLLEADINVLGERVKTVIEHSQRFLDDEQVEGYRPCDPSIVLERVQQLEDAYGELVKLAVERRLRLEESRKLWQFYWDMAEEENWIKEKEQILSTSDIGHDLITVNLLLTKHKTVEEELLSHEPQLKAVVKSGEELIAQQHFGSDKIQERIDEIMTMWTSLTERSANRKKRLTDAVDLHQFYTEADDVDTWMLDILRLVSSEDTGRDEATVQSLLKKHKDVTDELKNYASTIEQLHQQASELNQVDRESPVVIERLASIDRRYKELLELAKVRKQRLLDALSLYKLFTEADGVEQWIAEKERMLLTMVPAKDIEDCEIMKHRYEGFEQEMNANASRVAVVNQLARQLLHVEHPNSEDIIARQNQLNQRWAELREKAESKREELSSAHGVQTFHIECRETVLWIEDKKRVLMETADLGTDLSGIMTLQRRLSGMERDLAAIQAKLDALESEADKISQDHPEEAELIRERIEQIRSVWDQLTQLLKERDAKLEEAGDLHRFLRDLDHFQSWLTKTMTDVASEDIPSNLAEAEKLLSQHQSIREEIDNYTEDYIKMMEYGERITAEDVTPADDAQYMFLRERLKALKDGWAELHQMWENRQELLSQSLNLQMFLRDAKQGEVLLSQQEHYLSKDETPTNLEQAENLIKRHEAFLTTMEANDEKINGICQFAQRLLDEEHFAADKIQKKAENIEERRQQNRDRAMEQMERLRDQLQVHQFLQDCEELNDWVQEKHIIAQDESYRSAKTVHSKWTRHQAFEAEIASNKDRLVRVQEAGEVLVKEKPEMAELIGPKISELNQHFDALETTTKEKGERLFDANRQVLYEQTCDDIDTWMTDLEKQIEGGDTGMDLTSVNILMQKQQMIETQMAVKAKQVEQLESQADYLQRMTPDKTEEIKQMKSKVEAKFESLKAPLVERNVLLAKKKEAYQFRRDVEDEKLWILEKMPLATSPDYGNSLFTVHMLKKKLQSLSTEIDNHEPRINLVCDNGRKLIEEGHVDAEEFQKLLEDLLDHWTKLKDAMEHRRSKLLVSEKAQQYLFDAGEAEVWMSEQELYMMVEDRGKDEISAQNLMKKHQTLENSVDDYAETIRQLGETARHLINEGHPDSEQIGIRQSQIDKLYAGLRDLAVERRSKLDEALKLFMLNREVDDLEQWIAEREVVAGSHELGQDYEHVTMLRDRFKEFARDTEAIGTERVAAVNEIADQLISAGHSDAATIAEWKDGLNESWADLLELIETRTQMLAASWELHKFFHDCKDVLSRILEKQNSISDELGRDAGSVSALQRKHQNFVQDLVMLKQQVEQIQEDSSKLQAAYAGDKAREITNREAEVVSAWLNMQGMCEDRRVKLNDTSDLFKFFNMVRTLILWMDDVIRQMNTTEKPRDVSGVELLMNNHQSLKAEIDAREDNFNVCVSLGKELLSRNHYASGEIKDKLMSLSNQRNNMLQRWEERWEHLQLILEVYQFARDASVAEQWLMAQEPYLTSTELGVSSIDELMNWLMMRSIDDVENLIKKHEAFEKACSAQEERFAALERLTTLEAIAKTDSSKPSDALGDGSSIEVLPTFNRFISLPPYSPRPPNIRRHSLPTPVQAFFTAFSCPALTEIQASRHSFPIRLSSEISLVKMYPKGSLKRHRRRLNSSSNPQLSQTIHIKDSDTDNLFAEMRNQRCSYYTDRPVSDPVENSVMLSSKVSSIDSPFTSPSVGNDKNDKKLDGMTLLEEPQNDWDCKSSSSVGEFVSLDHYEAPYLEESLYRITEFCFSKKNEHQDIDCESTDNVVLRLPEAENGGENCQRIGRRNQVYSFVDNVRDSTTLPPIYEMEGEGLDVTELSNPSGSVEFWSYESLLDEKTDIVNNSTEALRNSEREKVLSHAQYCGDNDSIMSYYPVIPCNGLKDTVRNVDHLVARLDGVSVQGCPSPASPFPLTPPNTCDSSPKLTNGKHTPRNNLHALSQVKFELKELKRKEEEEEEERRRQEELARQAAAPPPQSPDQPTDGVDGAGDDSHVNGEEHDESREEHEEGAAVKGGSAPGTPRPPSTPVTPTPTAAAVRARPGSATLPPQSSISPLASKRPSPSGDEDQLEGSLVRKHEWESTTKKASNRSWDKVFVVLRGNMIFFYKDRKSYQAAPEVFFRAEAPVDVSGGTASVADDYTKKKHVMRLKLVGGAEYLFQAKDEEELAVWVGALQAAVSSEGSAGPSRSQTLPAGSEKKDEPKRRSFFTLKKK
ncbi:spectrin beta chain isoform X6 [Penaeus vannamei]|uniref:spectrin beta chain isoform X6 n=1 Tax=Penaeus vannamei TaxID=6689 RepID=UPI00387F6D44